MTDLSPAAQAVFNAAWTCPIVLGDHPATRSRQIAAAIRAAVETYFEDGNGEGPQWFLAIADELEAQ
jgi:hypothetical protein